MKGRTAAKQSERRDIDGASGAVEGEAEHMAQPANSGAVGDLREHVLRIEARDEGLRADVMGNVTGSNAAGAIGPEVDARSCQCGDADRDGDNGPFSQVHRLRDGMNTG